MGINMKLKNTTVKIITLLYFLLIATNTWSAALSWINKPINNGIYPDGIDGKAKVSTNGRYIAFSSSSANLVDADVNLHQDLFIKDTQTITGTQFSTGTYDFSKPTSDGQMIAFISDDPDLPLANGEELLYIKNLLTGVITAITYNAGMDPIRAIDDIYLTDDAHCLYFLSHKNIAANDTNGYQDVYRVDLQSNIFDLVSINTSGQAPVNSGYSSTLLDVSANGRYVTFTAKSNELHSDATSNNWLGYIRDMQFNSTHIFALNQLSNPAYETTRINYTNTVVSNSGKVYFCSNLDDLVANDNNIVADIFFKVSLQA